jgi:hypothetical protein
MSDCPKCHWSYRDCVCPVKPAKRNKDGHIECNIPWKMTDKTEAPKDESRGTDFNEHLNSQLKDPEFSAEYYKQERSELKEKLDSAYLTITEKDHNWRLAADQRDALAKELAEVNKSTLAVRYKELNKLVGRLDKDNQFLKLENDSLTKQLKDASDLLRDIHNLLIGATIKWDGVSAINIDPKPVWERLREHLGEKNGK